MELLKNISAKLQEINERFGEINADIVDFEIMKATSEEIYKQGKQKDLDCWNDENGNFKIKFDG